MKRKKRIDNKKVSKQYPVPPREPRTNHPPILPAFSSINISKMLSHFMTFRSTIRDLSSSLQRMEKMLDSTYQMFEIAQQMMNRQPRRSISPPSNTNQHESKHRGDDPPILQLPPEDEDPPNHPFGQLFNQIDPRILFQILQSPFVQRFISQFFTSPKKTVAKSQFRRKQG